MTVFVSKIPEEETVILQVRAEGNGTIGDCVTYVTPGQTAIGRTYDQWMAVNSDRVEIARLR